MDFVLEIKEKNNLKTTDISDFKRIYFGDSFCQNLIPQIKDLEESYKFIKDKNKEFTLNTPFVTDISLKSLLKDIECISKYEENCEVVFNDWGLFYEIKKRFPEIKLILGRLFAKQKTDPVANDIILNLQKTDTTNNIVPKKVPKSLYKLFQDTYLNNNDFQEFLILNNINRVELSFLKWNMILKLNNDIRASIYYPYSYITTTRNCEFLNMTNTNCTKICQKQKIVSTNDNAPYIIIGNTVYFSIEKYFSIKKIKKYLSIDRIIVNDIDAYNRYKNKWQ